MTDQRATIPDRTVWLDGDTVRVLDQRVLPFDIVEMSISNVEEMRAAIADMVVRGAGCIGACAGYGMMLAAQEVHGRADAPARLDELAQHLMSARPTAVNLEWAVRRQLAAIAAATSDDERVAIARQTAEQIATEDIAACAAIGQHGLGLIREIFDRTGRPVSVMTHCNAGWLAFVQHGSATAPMYAAHAADIPIHVYVSETRPRNQGARLTAWELTQAGIDVTLIVDNAAGHLMQHGMVDLVIVGSDRTSRCGDVGNKIGTYLKAAAARDNQVPFYAAMPSSTLDPAICDGIAEVPIEQRNQREVTWMSGRPDEPSAASGVELEVQLSPDGVDAVNYGFDVTPARLVTGIITERGICDATEAAILAAYPEFTDRSAS